MPYRPAVAVDALESRRLFAALVAGVSTSTTVSAASPNKNWTVDLTAGQALYVAAGEATTSAFQPQLILIGPNGKTVGRTTGDNGTMLGKVAPVTGRYVVRLRDTAGSRRADVNLTAFYTGSRTVADSDDAGVTASGRRYAASISPGDLDVWRVDGTAGQYLSVTANENTNDDPIGVGVALIGPDGAGVVADQSDTGFTFARRLTATGTYYAVAYEPGQNASGRYGISFGYAPGVQSTEDADTQQPLVSGTPRNGDLPSGDTDVFTVQLGRRVNVSVNVARTSGTTTPVVTLIDPAGNVVGLSRGGENASDSGAEFDAVGTTGRLRGTYYLILTGATPDTGGEYSLELTAG